MNKTGAWRTALACAVGWICAISLSAGCKSTALLGEPTGAGGGGASAPTGGTAPTTGGADARGGGQSTGGVGGFWVGEQHKSSQLDLLFVVDNSVSMADHQQVLRDVLPGLVTRLVAPHCLDASGRDSGPSSGGVCPAGTTLELQPVQSLHVGFITSSLGGHGKSCRPGEPPTSRDDDSGHLVGPNGEMGSAEPLLSYEAGSGADLVQFGRDVATRASLVGEQGCGYESTHEAWYRFLVDPEPPALIAINASNFVEAAGIDPTLLAHRAAFLRPTSAVAIVVLSDENDCSIIDYGQGWLVASETRLPGSTSQCGTNSNDPCCRSCKVMASAECGDPAADPACQVNAGEGYGPGYLAAQDDNGNLRCWQTKRRFGFDLLFPVQRYVDGLTLPTVPSRVDATLVQNPLFAGGRDPSLVTLVGIVGVPWQDLATNATRDAPASLELMSFAELTANGRWNMLVGTPGNETTPPTPPTDPFMNETIYPRAGSNPVTGAPIVSETSTNPAATINGHEFVVTDATKDDLQYACIFPLAAPRDCSAAEFNSTIPEERRGCFCKPGTEPRNRPLCSPPGGGPAGVMQYYAKAQPGIRHVEILKGLGPRGVTSSVCPKVTTGDVTAPVFGYNPTVSALLRRLSEMIE